MREKISPYTVHVRDDANRPDQVEDYAARKAMGGPKSSPGSGQP
jgi:hypothetical protein